MKKLLVVLIISCPLWSFSKSLDLDTIPRQVKEWCLSVNEQNKDYKAKLAVKDSVIHSQGTLLASKEGQLKSHQRDSARWYTETESYKLMYDSEVKFSDKQRKTIRKLKGKNTITFGALVLAVSVIVIDFFRGDED